MVTPCLNPNNEYTKEDNNEGGHCTQTIYPHISLNVFDILDHFFKLGVQLPWDDNVIPIRAPELGLGSRIRFAELLDYTEVCRNLK